MIVLLLGGLILFSSAQILLRNLFSIGFTWGDGLTRLAVLWLALLGALAASRDGRHITMGALVQWLPGRYKVVAGVLSNLFATTFCAAFAYTLLGVPAWWLQAIMPVAFALMAYRFFLQALRHLRGA